MTSQSRKAGLEKLEIVLSASAFWRGGRKGGLGGIPPAEPVNKVGSSRTNLLRKFNGVKIFCFFLSENINSICKFYFFDNIFDTSIY
jgi:hypothetical protein